MVKLTDEDRDLIQRAAEAFGKDHRYLESVLWAAHQRKGVDRKPDQEVA